MTDLTNAEVAGRLRWGALSGPAVLVLTAVVALWVASNRAMGDFPHMLEPMQRLVAGDFPNVYSDTGSGTSLTAWLAATIIPFLLARTIWSDQGAWVLAGLVAVPMLVASVRFTVRAINPTVSVSRAWLLAGLAAVLPTTLASWTEYYHPQDVAGAALVVAALGLAAKRQWAWSGLVFGLAILTRQWAILAALLVAPLTRTRTDFVKFAGAGTLVGAVGVVPWVLLGNSGVFAALTGSGAAITGHTFVGRFVGEGNTELLTVMRFIPLAVAAGVAAWMTITKKGDISWLGPLAVSAMGLRMLFDVAAYTYYWAPICIFFLLVRGPKWITPMIAAVASALAWALYPYVASSGQLGQLLTAIWVPVILAGITFAAWWLTDDETALVEHEVPSGPTPTAIWMIAAVAAVVVCSIGGVTIARNEEALPDGAIPNDMFSGTGTLTVTGDPLTLDPTGQPTGIIPRIETSGSNGTTLAVAPATTRAILITSHWCLECKTELDDLAAWAETNSVPLSQVAVIGVDPNPAKGNWPPELWLLSLNWEGPTLLDDAAGQVKTALGKPVVGTVIYLDASGAVTGVEVGRGI